MARILLLRWIQYFICLQTRVSKFSVFSLVVDVKQVRLSSIMVTPHRRNDNEDATVNKKGRIIHFLFWIL